MNETQVQCRLFYDDESIHLCIGRLNNNTMEVVHSEEIDTSSLNEEHIVLPNGDVYRVTMLGPDYNNENKTWKFFAYKSNDEAKIAKNKWTHHLHLRLAELSNKFTGMNRCIELIKENKIETFNFWELLFTLILHPIRFPSYINRLVNRRTLQIIEKEAKQLEEEWSIFLEAYELTKYK